MLYKKSSRRTLPPQEKKRTALFFSIEKQSVEKKKTVSLQNQINDYGLSKIRNVHKEETCFLGSAHDKNRVG
jgi:hypothetical protein